MQVEERPKKRRTTKKGAAPPAARDHSAIAEQFEEDVLSGRFPAGRLFRAAIERQRRDLASPPAGFAFDAATGDRACRLMECLPHAGEGPKRGQPFRLEPWQVWLVRTLFGWIDPVTGFARFRIASIWLPKGNGKSPLAALIALCVLILGNGGEKVYSAASTQKQARHVFDHAREMLHLMPKIAERFGLENREHEIRGTADGRKYEPVSSEAGSIEGIRPSVLVLDEVHVLPNRKLYDNLRSAANKVDGSRFVTISTAGFDMSPQAIGFQLYSRAKEVLERRADDPTLFALIVEADRKRPDGTDADPFSMETMRQANPNLGVSVSIAGLQAAAQTARDVPSERASFEVKHLGWWQATARTFIDPARWRELARPEVKLEDLGPEWTVTVGVDLARTRDLTAAPVVASRAMEDGKREYHVFSRMAYLAAQSVTMKLIPELRLWAEQGWLRLQPGETMGYGVVKEDIVDVCEPYPGAEVCFDDWCAAEMEQDLQGKGLTCVSIRQGAKTQSEPMRELEAATLDGRIHHDGSPVLEMCITNLIADTDRNGNIRPARENEYKKIDLAVALINALVRAMVGGGGEAHVGDLLL